MATDSDDNISLPRPPPPRPAARREAIDAALRKFDGIEEAVSEKRARKRLVWTGWATLDRRAVGALATAAVIAVVSVPLALTALRDQPHSVAPPMREPLSLQPSQDAAVENRPAFEAVQAPTAEAVAAAEPPSTAQRVASPPAVAAPAEQTESAADGRKAIQEAPAPLMAPAATPPPPPPPPPAPPPPPPAPARTEQYAGQATTQDMVVTGSRIPRPDLPKQGNARIAAERSAGPVSPLAVVDSYGGFLSRLQAAFRRNDRRAVVGLVGLPLRVNFDGGARTYRDRRSIERDFDRIFTPRVRRAILAQRADRLFTNYQGAMIGDGEVWFDQTCPNASCSPAGPVRVKAINPQGS